MASTEFTSFRERLLNGDFDLLTAGVSAALARSYTFNGAHVFLDDATTAGGVLVATQVLASKTTTGGTFDAGDPLYPTVAEGPDITSVLVWQSTDAAGGVIPTSAQLLICFIDGGDLPVTPNGRDIEVRWDNLTVNGIVALT